VIHTVAGDKFAWLRDDEFARQAVSGVNPVSIESLKVFPPKSNLDPEIYGPQESAFKEEHILGHLNGLSVSQVIIINFLLSFCYIKKDLHYHVCFCSLLSSFFFDIAR
jgi:lipoxygenase